VGNTPQERPMTSAFGPWVNERLLGSSQILILVTGVFGFIGSNLIERFKACYVEVLNVYFLGHRRIQMLCVN
jgi:hypothetical protein